MSDLYLSTFKKLLKPEWNIEKPMFNNPIDTRVPMEVNTVVRGKKVRRVLSYTHIKLRNTVDNIQVVNMKDLKYLKTKLFLSGFGDVVIYCDEEGGLH